MAGWPASIAPKDSVNCTSTIFLLLSDIDHSACAKITFMGIPNVRRFRISSPDGGQTATVMAVLPKGANVDAYVSDAAKRFDWKAYSEAQQKQFKVRVGQQKQ